MVIDSSAIVAIAFDEAEAETFERLISSDPIKLMSAATLLKVAMVVEARLGNVGRQLLDYWLYRAAVDIVSVDIVQAEIARSAWRRFGKGRHSASLNFDDCFLRSCHRPRRTTAFQRQRLFANGRHRRAITGILTLPPYSRSRNRR